MTSATERVMPNAPDEVGAAGGWSRGSRRNLRPPAGMEVAYPAIGSLGSSPTEQEVTRIRRFSAFDVPFTKPLYDRIPYSALPLPRRSRLWVRYTLRREYMQNAQRFPQGLREHPDSRPPARYSTYPFRMVPTRRTRLSIRNVPGSFGQTTEVLNG